MMRSFELATYDIATCDGVVHRGFRATSALEAKIEFLIFDPGYRDDDIVAAGIALRPAGNGFVGKRMRRAA